MNQDDQQQADAKNEPKRRRRRGLDSPAPSQPAGNKGLRRGRADTGPKFDAQQAATVDRLLLAHDSNVATVQAILESDYPDLPELTDAALRYRRSRLTAKRIEKVRAQSEAELDRGVAEYTTRCLALRDRYKSQVQHLLEVRKAFSEATLSTDRLAWSREVRSAEAVAVTTLQQLHRMLMPNAPLQRTPVRPPGALPAPGQPPLLPEPDGEIDIQQLWEELEAGFRMQFEAEIAWQKAQEIDNPDVVIDMPDYPARS